MRVIIVLLFQKAPFVRLLIKLAALFPGTTLD